MNSRKPDILKTEAGLIRHFIIEEARVSMLSGVVGEHGVPLFVSGMGSFYIDFALIGNGKIPCLRVRTNAKKGIKEGTVIKVLFTDQTSTHINLVSDAVNFGSHKEFYTTIDMVSVLALSAKLVDCVTISSKNNKETVRFEFSDCDFYHGKEDGQKLMQIMVQRVLGFMDKDNSAPSQNSSQLSLLDDLLTVLK